MSCYFRHLKDILNEAGIEVTSDNKKQIDQAIHSIVDITYKNCPDTWKKLKLQLSGGKQKQHEFIDKLHNAAH